MCFMLLQLQSLLMLQLSYLQSVGSSTACLLGAFSQDVWIFSCNKARLSFWYQAHPVRPHGPPLCQSFLLVTVLLQKYQQTHISSPHPHLHGLFSHPWTLGEKNALEPKASGKEAACCRACGFARNVLTAAGLAFLL